MAHATLAHAVESNSARAALARHAGMKKISFTSVVAGTLVAYGAFAVMLAGAAAAAEAVGFDTDLTTSEWRDLGAAGAAVVSVVLLLCYLFGGYVAGRMARRAGAVNGAMVFVVGLLVALGIAGVVNVFTDGDVILSELRELGIPTSGDEWRDVATLAGAGSLLAMLLGSILGGRIGERWHAKLLMRAADPTYGPESEERAAAERHRNALRRAEERAAERHDEADDQVRHATAAAAVPASGWYEETSSARLDGPPATDGDRDRGPRHRIRAAK